MPRVSYHWLFCLTMALVLAIATPVAAGGHHNDAACVGNLAGQDSAVAWESAMVDSGELDTAAASLCSMPCAQCPASMARLANDAVASSDPLSRPGLGTLSGHPAPFERPPRA